MNLSEIIKGIRMNRVTLLGYGMLGSGLAGIIYGNATNDKKTIDMSFEICRCGACLVGATFSGIETYKSYKRAKEHIALHGTLDRRFAMTSSFLYCDRQGVYMAAKETGHLKEFRKAVKWYFNIIPNF